MPRRPNEYQTAHKILTTVNSFLINTLPFVNRPLSVCSGLQEGDIFVGAELAGFALGAAYQTHEEYEGADDVDIYGVSLAYDAEVVAVAVDYSNADDGNEDVSVWNIYVSAPVAKGFKVGAGYSLVDYSDPYELNEDEIKAWYVNATYKFPQAKNFRVFAEVAGSDEIDASGEEYDTGFLVVLA